MKVNIQNFQEYPHFKGGEGSLSGAMFFDGMNRVLHGLLVPGASIGLHRHTDSSEVIYILRGNPMIITEGEEERYAAGECHYCPKGTEHTLINDTDEEVEFVAVIPMQ